MNLLPPVEEVLAKLQKLGVSVPSGAVRVSAYGDSPELSESLLALIRSGQKRAGTSLLWMLEAEGELPPAPGHIDLVVNHLNEPVLVCRITEVRIVPFNQVTAEYAVLEGEGDGSLDYWRKEHWAFFSRECQNIGKQPDQQMMVVCSAFEVINVISEQTT